MRSDQPPRLKIILYSLLYKVVALGHRELLWLLQGSIRSLDGAPGPIEWHQRAKVTVPLGHVELQVTIAGKQAASRHPVGESHIVVGVVWLW